MLTSHRVAIAMAVLAAIGCKSRQASVRVEPVASATTRAAELPPSPPAAAVEKATGTIETVDVPGDTDLLVVRGHGEDARRPIVFLHGMCADPRDGLEGWASGVTAHGTILALRGDLRCSDGRERTSWSTDPSALDARIDAAMNAVRTKLGVPLDERELIVIGESMGASRTMKLARDFPAKYTRLVLVGAPETPSVKDLADARAVALLAGEREGQGKMRQGTKDLQAAGLEARFSELPDAVHGAYGSDGPATMGDAVAFVER